MFIRMRNVADKSCREHQNTHFMFDNCFSFFENRAVYEKMWKNIVQPDRSQTTIWRMRIAWWIPKATNTHSQYVILIDFPLQQWKVPGYCLSLDMIAVALRWRQVRSIGGITVTGQNWSTLKKLGDLMSCAPPVQWMCERGAVKIGTSHRLAQSSHTCKQRKARTRIQASV
jgi:hypothetical protein